MEFLPLRRKSCLQRLRINCPFRKLRRQTYGVSATSSTISSIWDNVGLSASNQSLSLLASGYNPSETDDRMEEDPAENHPNQKNQSNRAGNSMNRDGIDPETGERAQE